MPRRLFAIAAWISLVLCLATAGLWTLGGLAARSWKIYAPRGRYLLIYARRSGIALRTIDSNGATTWDLPYETVIILTSILPALWVRSRFYAQPRMPTRTYEQQLRSRIDFLLPTVVVAGVMLGLAALAIDSRRSASWVVVGPLEVALLVNVVARGRLRLRLKRLLAGNCPMCGYNLTGNVSGNCPECGTPVPPMVETQTDVSLR